MAGFGTPSEYVLDILCIEGTYDSSVLTSGVTFESMANELYNAAMSNKAIPVYVKLVDRYDDSDQVTFCGPGGIFVGSRDTGPYFTIYLIVGGNYYSFAWNGSTFSGGLD